MQPLTIPTFVFADIQLLQRPRRRYAVFVKIASPDTLQWLQTHFDDPYVGFKAAIRAYDKQASTIATHCMTCGKKLTDRQMIESSVYCSHKCAANNKDKQAATAHSNLVKYGCPSPLQNRDILQKKRQTMIDRYGDNYGSIIRAKGSVTNISKYQSSTPFNGSKKLDSEKTHRANFYPKFIESLKARRIELVTPKDQYINGTELLTYRCIDCQTTWTTTDRDVYHFNVCQCRRRRSIGEQQLVELIESIYDGSILTNDRSLASIELDVALPDIAIAFEYNGEYWHSNKPIDYHLNKTIKCHNQSISLYHIWEVDWFNKRSQVVKLITQAITPTKIECTNFKSIDVNQYCRFMNDQSLNEPNPVGRLVGGYDCDGRLVIVLCYDTIGSNIVVINQYATINYATVDFNRLFTNITVIVDGRIDICQDQQLMSLGFSVIGTSNPTATYSRNRVRLTLERASKYNTCNCTYDCGRAFLAKNF